VLTRCLFLEYFDVEFYHNKTAIEVGRPGYGGVEVTMFTEFQNDKKLYTGFEFAATGEYHDADEKSEFFKSSIVGPNQVAFILPAVDRMFQDDFEQLWGNIVGETHAFYCERTMKAHKITRVLLKTEENAHYLSRVIILNFPSSMVLSNGIFSPQSENGRIRSDRMPMHIKVRHNKLHINKTRVIWKVHIKDDDAKKVEVSTAKDSKEELYFVEDMFKSMGL
jgi:hypothetical protein